MKSSHLKVVESSVMRPVGRKPNAAYRSREHLTEREVERLVEAAKDNRWGHRDATMVLLAFRHGLRASELVDLRWGADRPGKRRPARP
jgi:integrase